MKNWIYLVLGTATALFMVACGGGGGSGSRNTLVNGAGSCQAGYVWTSQYNCLPQSSCPPGYGMYQNSCIQGSVNNQTCTQAGYYPTQYGCLPQGGCQPGSALYNNQTCVQVTNYNNGYNGYNGYNGGYQGGYNGGYQGGYIPYYPNYPQQQWGYQYQRYCYWYYGQLMCQ